MEIINFISDFFTKIITHKCDPDPTRSGSTALDKEKQYDLNADLIVDVVVWKSVLLPVDNYSHKIVPSKNRKMYSSTNNTYMLVNNAKWEKYIFKSKNKYIL